MSKLRSKLSYANVMSTFAAFMVLGGGAAYAHGLIGTNDIRDRAVTNPKIAKDTLGTNKIQNRAVSNTKIRTGSIAGGKLRNNTITGAKVNESTLGTVPAAVNAGNALDIADGVVSAAKLGDVVRRSSSPVFVDGGIGTGTTELILIGCQPGEQLLTGGGSWDGTPTDGEAELLHIVSSGPTAAQNWHVRVYNGNLLPRDFTAHALCLTN